MPRTRHCRTRTRRYRASRTHSATTHTFLTALRGGTTTAPPHYQRLPPTTPHYYPRNAPTARLSARGASLPLYALRCWLDGSVGIACGPL